MSQKLSAKGLPITRGTDADKALRMVFGGETFEDLTWSEQKAQNQQIAVSAARKELEKNKGKDGKVDPSAYMRLRLDWAEAVGTADEFDDIFKSMLSEDEQFNLGLIKI
jgi:hypothetical protein